MSTIIINRRDGDSLTPFNFTERKARLSGTYDPTIVAYRNKTGATQLDALNSMTRYLKTQNLYSDTMFASFKAAQNYGSGASVATLGGAQANDFALINGPTWHDDGIRFLTSESRYATLDFTGINNAEAITVFFRKKATGASVADGPGASLWSIGSFGGSGSPTPNRGVTSNLSTGVITEETWALFFETPDTTQGRLGTTAGNYSWLEGEDYVEVLELSAAGTKLYKNTAARTINLQNQITTATNTSPAATGFAADNLFFVGALRTASLGQFWDGICPAIAVHRGPILTATQRETITNLLHAL